MAQLLQAGSHCAALSDPRCKTFVNSLVWPRDCFVRELLIILLEVDFACVPEEEAKQPLLDYCRSICGTKVVEDGFNVEKNKEKFSKRNLVGKLGRWHVLLARDTLAEYDRRPLQITAVAKTSASASEKVTASICEGTRVTSAWAMRS